jgi:hypothetical protein
MPRLLRNRSCLSMSKGFSLTISTRPCRVGKVRESSSTQRTSFLRQCRPTADPVEDLRHRGVPAPFGRHWLPSLWACFVELDSHPCHPLAFALGRSAATIRELQPHLQGRPPPIAIMATFILGPPSPPATQGAINTSTSFSMARGSRISWRWLSTGSACCVPRGSTARQPGQTVRSVAV